MSQYDYLIVGTGLFGSVFAYEAMKRGKKVLLVEKRSHIGGNVYTEKREGIEVHMYGAHIFHTADKTIWDYVNQFAKFNHFVNSPLAMYKGELYNLPFNMNTFHQLWGVVTPEQARAKMAEQLALQHYDNPQNLEEQAINLVGLEIYQKFIKGYTEKQWGRNADTLPAFIINRIPVRFTFDNNYFRDPYQGIPIGGYTAIIEKMLSGATIMTNTDYFQDRKNLDDLAEKVLFTGPIDRFFDFRFGVLEYRSLRFDHRVLDVPDFQGNAVVNYNDRDVPFTRIIEHKHFEFGNQAKTIITKEYPDEWNPKKEAYYSINNEKNNEILKKYQEAANNETKYLFGGRLAEYRYYDMDKVIASALKLVSQEFEPLLSK